MENDQIVDVLELLVKLWDLHGLNEFKSKNLAFAARGLDKFPGLIANLSEDELLAIPGVGKVVVKIVQDVATSGTCSDMEQIIEQTPPGLLLLLKIKGLGPKKVRTIWQELQITEIDDLLAACEDGRLGNLKGFGGAVVESVTLNIHFIKSNSSKLRINKAQDLADEIVQELCTTFTKVSIVGELRRNCEVISSLVFLVETDDLFGASSHLQSIDSLDEDLKESSPFTWRGFAKGHLIPVEIHFASSSEFVSKIFALSASPEHLTQVHFYERFEGKELTDEKHIYASQNLSYIEPEMREGLQEFEWAANLGDKALVNYEDLRGCLHNHSTYSDGKNSLSEMAEACRALGLSYFGIADHSKYAAYAGGLKEEDVLRQHAEIDQLNLQWSDFQILKGIEADILPDGSLDYDASVLSSFDYVVASVHAGLMMDLEKAMPRVMKAIENPFTSILGHPTGRLLLVRPGFPLQMSKILDACKANGVSIELNASPYRLDLDWRHIYEAMDKGVYVSINPDAHAIAGLRDMEWGVKVGRKGGLLKELTLNALTLEDIKRFFSKN
ncbi:PHP domain-containing protein [Aquirufa sp. A-Brett2-15D]